MNILIDNAGFVNKGSGLMVHTIINTMKTLYPGKISFAIRKKPVKGEIKKLYQYRNQKRQNLIPVIILPSFITKRVFGFIHPKDIGLVMDAGGFRFGDSWSKLYTKKEIDFWVDFYKRQAKQGCKIIMLPQAFGPFETKTSREFIEKVFPFFDLVFAREKQSLQHLTDLFGKNAKIKIAPDFTNTFQPVLTEKDKRKFETFINKVCIIPNKKMITHTSREIGDGYLKLLVSLTKTINKRGHSLFFLNHEGKEDENLILEIIRQSGFSSDYLTGLNASQTKYIIGKSRLCVSSRYHGLVSALSQGVPGFCTSWSHKYQELLNDYDHDEGLISVLEPKNGQEKILSLLDDPGLYENVKNKILMRSKKEVQKTKEMWDEVMFF